MDFTKYTVVTSDDFGKFEDRVNQLLGDGWRLQGGVSTTAFHDSGKRLLHLQWSQALTLPSSESALEAVKSEAELLPRDLETFSVAVETIERDLASGS